MRREVKFRIFPEIKVRVVLEEPCPYCGAYWGHPDPKLNYPNRPKVGDEYGWWWRCYNPRCPVGYYQPEHKLVAFAVNLEFMKKDPSVAEMREDAKKVLASKGWKIVD